MPESLLSTATLPSTLAFDAARTGATLGDSSLGARQRSFAEVLAISDRSPQDVNSKVDASRDAAERLVATSVVEPILMQLRESLNIAPPFGPGKGEESFRGIADAHTAKEIVKSKNFGLVDRLAQQLRERSAPFTDVQVQETSV